MPYEDRTFTDLFQGIVQKVQEIIRSEVRLARAEVTQEAKKTASASLVFGAGAVLAFYSVGVLLLAGIYGLSAVVPPWAAALVIWAVVSGIAAILLISGRARFRQVHAKPEATIQSVKENVQWLKNQTR